MRKKTIKRTAVAELAPFRPELAVEALMQIPEFKESMVGLEADAILALEDVGWLRNFAGQDSTDVNPVRRERMVNICRSFWRSDPLAKQAVRLYTDYAIGTGITYKANGKSTEIDAFWKYRKNKRLTGSRGQQRLSKKLLVDGEIFFAIFGGEGDKKVIRAIDPLQIKDVISDPSDEDEILCYKRIDKSSPPKTTYYKDWAADDEDLVGLKDPESKGDITVEEGVVVYHLPFDDLGKRGNSLLSSVVGWSHGHKRFMESRVAITAALAKFAWKLTAKGGQKLLDSMQQKLQSSLVTSTNSLEKNPPPAAGATWAQNSGVDMAPMPRASGAGDAEKDSNSLKLMVSAGTNIMLHYFGDPLTGNLATATAMELPMLKTFVSYQELWKDAWRDIFSIVLEEDIDEEPAKIEMSLPAMLQEDLRKMGAFLTGLHQVFPQVEVPEILSMCLVALGVTDVDAVMKSIAVRKTELAAAAEKIQQATVKQPVPAQAGDVAVKEAEKIEALNKLSSVLKEVFAA